MSYNRYSSENGARPQPQSTRMSMEEQGRYLNGLRNNPLSRPTGSRPLPKAPFTDRQYAAQPVSSGAGNGGSAPIDPVSSKQMYEPQDSVPPNRPINRDTRVQPGTSDQERRRQKGRPLVQGTNALTSARPRTRKITPILNGELKTTPNESIAREHERQEAQHIREILEAEDEVREEERLHSAAQAEAAELVWQHQNPRSAEIERTSAYRNPDLNTPSPPVRREVFGNSANPGIRSSTPSSAAISRGSSRGSLPWLKKRVTIDENIREREFTNTSPQSNGIVPEPVRTPRATSNGSGRRVSTGSRRSVSRDLNGDIYQEVIEHSSPSSISTTTVITHHTPLRERDANSIKGARALLSKSQSMPNTIPTHSSTYELQDSPASRPRTTPQYPPRALPQAPIVEEPEDYEWLEIRPQDIREATSFRRSDRSPKLPTPTAVSDRAGRPIVSFNKDWRPDNSPRNDQELHSTPMRPRDDGAISYPVSPTPAEPKITIMEMPRQNSIQRKPVSTTYTNRESLNMQGMQRDLPSIVEPHNRDRLAQGSGRSLPLTNQPLVPSISIDNHDGAQPVQRISSNQGVPSINIESEPVSDHRSPVIAAPVIQVHDHNPLPTSQPSINIAPSAVPNRPLPVPRSAPAKPTWMTPASSIAGVPPGTATCAACQLPISGRIVTAAASTRNPSQKARFHPKCFTCFHCNTPLEHVSFYPEPDDSRLERIQAAHPHYEPTSPQVIYLASSTQDLRFFCHLDHHELFSPRCHHCKTPIEGAASVALGRHYHPEHFFCAECGDPFTGTSPFVEHNDYAYCVSCHTKRTSSRCRGCKKPILNEMSVEALGGKWHEDCFVCCDCAGGFGEDGRFFVREFEVPLTEKESRRGMLPKVEELAACQSCEERRVKNTGAFL